MVFPAGGGFHPAGHIYAKGLYLGHGLGHVVRGQAAGQQQAGDGGGQVGGEGPVGYPAGAAAQGGVVGVDEQ